MFVERDTNSCVDSDIPEYLDKHQIKHISKYKDKLINKHENKHIDKRTKPECIDKHILQPIPQG